MRRLTVAERFMTIVRTVRTDAGVAYATTGVAPFPKTLCTITAVQSPLGWTRHHARTVSQELAAAIHAAGEQAPHGQGEATVVDTNVRNVKRISPADVMIDPSFDETLRTIVGTAKQDLGLKCDVAAQLHNLLVYGPGGKFLPHKDSEKEPGMFGTLIVTVPCAHAGGQFSVRHDGDEVQFVGAGNASLPTEWDSKTSGCLRWCAFYADCEHELLPVTSGHRIAVVYNLVRASSSEATPEAPPEAAGPGATLQPVVTAADSFQQLAQDWTGDGMVDGSTPPPPDKMVYFLAHEYTQDGLSWETLKGEDAAVCLPLQDAGAYDLVLCRLEITERGDEHTGHDVYQTEFAPSNCKLPPGQRNICEILSTQSIGTVDVLAGPLMERALARMIAQVKPWSEYAQVGHFDLTDPDSTEFEGYTGNEGSPKNSWYDRAAVVLWPRINRMKVLLGSDGEIASQESAERIAAALRRLGTDSSIGQELEHVFFSVSRTKTYGATSYMGNQMDGYNTCYDLRNKLQACMTAADAESKPGKISASVQNKATRALLSSLTKTMLLSLSSQPFTPLLDATASDYATQQYQLKAASTLKCALADVGEFADVAMQTQALKLITANRDRFEPLTVMAPVVAGMEIEGPSYKRTRTDMKRAATRDSATALIAAIRTELSVVTGRALGSDEFGGLFKTLCHVDEFNAETLAQIIANPGRFPLIATVIPGISLSKVLQQVQSEERLDLIGQLVQAMVVQIPQHNFNAEYTDQWSSQAAQDSLQVLLQMMGDFEALKDGIGALLDNTTLGRFTVMIPVIEKLSRPTSSTASNPTTTTSASLATSTLWPEAILFAIQTPTTAEMPKLTDEDKVKAIVGAFTAVDRMIPRNSFEDPYYGDQLAKALIDSPQKYSPLAVLQPAAQQLHDNAKRSGQQATAIAGFQSYLESAIASLQQLIDVAIPKKKDWTIQKKACYHPKCETCKKWAGFFAAPTETQLSLENLTSYEVHHIRGELSRSWAAKAIRSTPAAYTVTSMAPHLATKQLPAGSTCQACSGDNPVAAAWKLGCLQIAKLDPAVSQRKIDENKLARLKEIVDAAAHGQDGDEPVPKRAKVGHAASLTKAVAQPDAPPEYALVIDECGDSAECEACGLVTCCGEVSSCPNCHHPKCDDCKPCCSGCEKPMECACSRDCGCTRCVECCYCEEDAMYY